MTLLSRIFGTDLQPYRIRMTEVIKELHDLAVNLRQQELAQSLSDFRETVHEPFLFVIAGEVKVGKSSFINALLATGEEIVAVAPDPCTDTIQQVMYGSSAETIEINPYFKKILLPVEILKQISIVDTPGTNTISEHHQEITERFVPRSDLVVFVFEAKNPYRQSAWEFFQFIHSDWHKKIIFVLQQSDLMSPEDLAINVEGLRKHAIKQGIADPHVFALSAKMELEGKTDTSGFEPLRAYIRDNITSLDAFALKMKSSLNSAANYQGKLSTPLQLLSTQLINDKEFRREVSHTLKEQQDRSHKQVEQLIDRMIDDYDRITGTGKATLAEELGVLKLTGKSLRSIFNKQSSPQASMEVFTKDLEDKLRTSFEDRIQDGIEDIADSIRQMAEIIDLKIKSSNAMQKPQQDVFGDISERRRMVLRELKENFGEFLQRTETFVGREVFPEASTFSPNLAAGSGMAVIGVVLAVATSLPALDITGGIISTLGVLFAGGTILTKRGKIIKGFSDEISKGRQQLRSVLEEKLKAYVNHIRLKIDENFAEFDQLIKEQTIFLEEQQGLLIGIGEKIETLRKKIG
ncbi:MAG: dynamin family protein [Bacteroidia bacterium]|nr:dynamin family protein [Bacteroidia bacterium]